jgi:DNA-binding NtrC family response regulator
VSETIILAAGLEGRDASIAAMLSSLDGGLRFVKASGMADAARAGAHLAIVGCDRGTWPGAMAGIRALRSLNRCCPVVVLAWNSCEDLAIDALRSGATEYFRMPMPVAALREPLRRLLARGGEPGGLCELDGNSAPMERLRAQIARVAPTDSNVLIGGETGTGKELAAQLIHRNSARRGRRFLCINCAAIPDALLESELFGHEKGAFTGADREREGKLQAADGGTVFLDEIGDMNAAAQAKVLRVLEARNMQRLGGHRDIHLDIRVVAATNRDLEQLVREQKFRQDLYYRLNVARIRMPALRERMEDVSPLFERFLAEFARRASRPVPQLRSGLMETLLAYDWPGNVRELRNVAESCLIFSGPLSLGVEDLPEPLRRFSSPENERERLLYALTSAEWNKSEAAKRLNCSRMTVYRKMEKYRIGRAHGA